MDVMVIRVVEFSSGRYKIGKIFALNINIPKGNIELVLWEVPKIGHHFWK
jgi:hypothetical protein